MAERLFIDERNLRETGMHEQNIRTIRALTDFINVQNTVDEHAAVIAPLEALATTGLLVRTGTNAYTTRSVTGTSGHITVADGDGVAGAPTLSLPNSGVTAASYTFTSLTVDAQGRITTASNGDVAAALLSNLGGDPNADRILFWDDSAGAFKFLTVGTNLTVTGTTLDASGGAGGSFRGALVKKAADQTTANYSSNTTITWDAEEYDTDNIHDPADNTKLIVPSGVSYVKLWGTVSISSATAADWISLRLIKNGSAATALPFLLHEGGSTNQGMLISTPPLAVSAADYFQMQLQVESDASITVNANRSAFAMHIIS